MQAIFKQFAKAEEATGIAALGLDLKAVLLQAGTFVLLFFLIRKFALQKIVGALDARRQKIEESLKTADEIEQRMTDTRAETDQMIQTARRESDTIVAKAKAEADSIVKSAEDTAQIKAQKITEDALHKVDAQAERVRSQLKAEMTGLVAEATEAVLVQKMDSTSDRDLIRRALSQERA